MVRSPSHLEGRFASGAQFVLAVLFAIAFNHSGHPTDDLSSGNAQVIDMILKSQEVAAALLLF
jgi:hypothetical protein